MPRHCKLKEPEKVVGPAYPFGVNDKGVPLFECIRLIYGTIDIENKLSGKSLSFRRCFVINKSNKLGKNWLKFIIRNIFEEDLNLDDASSFLKKGSNDNKEFWEELKSELCLCLAARQQRLYTECFLYLYRIIELISIALPLVYASSQPDYRKALEFIKSLSVSSRDGDLSIFKNFVKKAEQSGGYNNIQIDFPFLIDDAPWRIEAKLQIESMINLERGLSCTFNDEGSVLLVKFSEMPLFFASCRNRLFHNSNSGENFRLDGLNGASELCRMLVDPTIYWFSLILIEVTKVHAKRYI